MEKDKENTDKNIKAKRTRIRKAPINDGMNTPVPDSGSARVSSDSEAALFKQAENPLGDPHKI